MMANSGPLLGVSGVDPLPSPSRTGRDGRPILSIKVGAAVGNCGRINLRDRPPLSLR